MALAISVSDFFWIREQRHCRRNPRPRVFRSTPPLRNHTPESGSHTVIALLEAGHTVTIVDNLSNSFLRVLDHVKKIADDKASGITFSEVREWRGRGEDESGGDAKAVCARRSQLPLPSLTTPNSFTSPQIDLRNRDELDKVFAAKK